MDSMQKREILKMKGEEFFVTSCNKRYLFKENVWMRLF